MFSLYLRYLSLAVLCHPLHKEKFILLSQKAQESSSEANESDAPPDDKATSQPPQSAPRDQDIELTDILENLFANLPHELSVWKLSQKAKYDGVHGESSDSNDDRVVDFGSMDSDQIVSDFMEEAICTAVLLM